MPHNQRQSDTLTASVICIMPAPPPAPATSYPCKYCCRSEKIFPPPARLASPAAAAAACPLVRGAGDDWSGAPPQSPATSPAHSAAGKTAKTEFCSINGILIPFLPSLNMSPCTAAVLGPNTPPISPSRCCSYLNICIKMCVLSHISYIVQESSHEPVCCSQRRMDLLATALLFQVGI